MLDINERVGNYVADLDAEPVIVTIRLLEVFFRLWLVGLQCSVLHVVSGFTARGAWITGVVLGSVFVVVPWAFQRF